MTYVCIVDFLLQQVESMEATDKAGGIDPFDPRESSDGNAEEKGSMRCAAHSYKENHGNQGEGGARNANRRLDGMYVDVSFKRITNF